MRTAFDPTDFSGAMWEWHQRLREAMLHYDEQEPYYDEIFHDVSRRLQREREAGKADIAILAFWKRSAQGSKWIGQLLSIPEATVRRTTRASFAETEDAARLAALELPGLRRQEALATTLLCAYDPDNIAVMDRRARTALNQIGLGVPGGRGVTLRYLARVRAIRDDLTADGTPVSARDVDKGLFVLGGSNG